MNRRGLEKASCECHPAVKSADDRLLPETGKERLGSAFEEAPSLS
jgi:hypothetical protein